MLFRWFFFFREMVYKVQVRDRNLQGGGKAVREVGEKYGEDGDFMIFVCLKVKELRFKGEYILKVDWYYL